MNIKRPIYIHTPFILSLLDPSVDGVVPKDYSQRNNTNGGSHNNVLSEREHEVLRLWALGYTSREIGKELIVNIKTVDSDKMRVKAKLGLRTRSELVAYALIKRVFYLMPSNLH